MKTLIWLIAAVLLGAAAGGALGYWEARPWTMQPAALTPTPAAGAAKAVATASEPKVSVVGGVTYNFDKMESGATQSHVFPVSNTGTAPLSVEFTSHTCKCTTIELNGKPVEEEGKKIEANATMIVPPGGEGKILVEWVAQAEPGPFRHGAKFITNDESTPRIELDIEGEVVASTTLQPAQMVFGAVRVGETGKSEMFVMSLLEPDVEILSHEIIGDELAKRLTITIDKVPKDQLPNPEALAGVKITAQYEPGGSLGPFGGSLRLKTNLKRAPTLVAPIYGNVSGDVSIFGKGWNEQNGLLKLDPATTASGVSTRLNVALRGDHAKATELKIASVSPPELKASLGEPKTLRDNLVHIPLTVEVPPGTPPMVRAGEDQGGEGEIVLSTNHPVTKEVRLRVNFTVKP